MTHFSMFSFTSSRGLLCQKVIYWWR